MEALFCALMAFFIIIFLLIGREIVFTMFDADIKPKRKPEIYKSKKKEKIKRKEKIKKNQIKIKWTPPTRIPRMRIPRMTRVRKNIEDSESIGNEGERIVKSLISILAKEQYRDLHDIMLETKFGTTQIDHIIVSVYGIFVIETKNYKGWITGSENSEKWVQNMFGNKYPFRNPLKQNYGHVKALEELLEIHFHELIPIVTFSDNCDIRVETDKSVVNFRDLIAEISSFTEFMFSKEDVYNISRKISKSNIIDKNLRERHALQIKKKLRKKEENIKNGICPRCGGDLVGRDSEYGKFIGCDNFPQCRFKLNDFQLPD